MVDEMPSVCHLLSNQANHLPTHLQANNIPIRVTSTLPQSPPLTHSTLPVATICMRMSSDGNRDTLPHTACF